MGGKTQAGMLSCRDCRKKFSCRTGSVMERSHVPLPKWLLATHLMAASKKGMSAHQLAPHARRARTRPRGSWRTASARACATTARCRSAALAARARSRPTKPTTARSTRRATAQRRRYSPVTKGGHSGPANKRAVLALVERGGKARLFHLAVPDKVTVDKIVRENVAKEAKLYTDESKLYLGSVDALRGP